MIEATVTITLEPSEALRAKLDAKKPANTHEAHPIMDPEFERRSAEARALLASAMKGWRLKRDDLAMFIRKDFGLGYQQVFERK